MYVGSLDPAESSRLVLNGGSNAKYAEGHVLFMRGGTLMAQPFDADRMELTGEGTPVAERVEVGGSTGQSGAFSVSNAGVLVYQLANGSELGHQLAGSIEPASRSASSANGLSTSASNSRPTAHGQPFQFRAAARRVATSGSWICCET